MLKATQTKVGPMLYRSLNKNAVSHLICLILNDRKLKERRPNTVAFHSKKRLRRGTDGNESLESSHKDHCASNREL